MDQNETYLFSAADRDVSGDGTFVSALTAISPSFILRDEALGVAKKRVIAADTDSFFVLVPVVGGVDLISGQGHAAFAGPHELLSFSAAAGTHFVLFNPYQEGVNVVLLEYKGITAETGLHQAEFNLEAHNVLLTPDTEGPALHIGLYDEGMDGTFACAAPTCAFVLNGSFDIGGRILQSRDAMMLSSGRDVIFNALSGDAILLLAELPS
jgi:quercetin 2,3-dioxygenase